MPYRPPTGADIVRAITRYRRRVEERQRTLEGRARLAKARAEALAVARMLKERFGARRVRLFGSLARGDADPDRFDIDIAVEGMKDADSCDAWGAARELVTREIDVVALTDIVPPLLRRRVEEDGVDLP